MYDALRYISKYYTVTNGSAAFDTLQAPIPHITVYPPSSLCSHFTRSSRNTRYHPFLKQTISLPPSLHLLPSLFQSSIGRTRRTYSSSRKYFDRSTFWTLVSRVSLAGAPLSRPLNVQMFPPAQGLVKCDSFLEISSGFERSDTCERRCTGSGGRNERGAYHLYARRIASYLFLWGFSLSGARARTQQQQRR